MNSRRYTMTSLSIVFLAITMVTVSGLGQNAYAVGLSISVDADYASGSISVSGDTDRSDDVTILVTAENGNISAVDQVSPSGGSYSTTLSPADMDGDYTISAQQGDAVNVRYKVSVEISSASPSGSASNVIPTTAVDAGGNEISDKTGVDMEEAPERFVLSATGVEGSTTIDVSGTTDRSSDITIQVIAPNGNIISISQITPSGGSFMTTIETGGALWTQDGMYTISTYQGDATDAMGNAQTRTWNDELKAWTLDTVQNQSTVNNITATGYQKSVQVEVLDGHVVPEFGVIAGVILAVAIASIIAVSAKSRLALVPKY